MSGKRNLKMSIINLFSKRQKQLRGDNPDVFSYDQIPYPLRIQIIYLWEETLGDEADYNSSFSRTNTCYRSIVEALCREYGCFRLAEDRYSDRNYYFELIDFFIKEKDAEKVVDAIELSFKGIDTFTRDYIYRERAYASKEADEAISELNARFLEHGVGYKFESGQIIRIDSEFLHSETVKPALVLLSAKIYSGAQQEFLKAFEHYRKKNYKESINEALKSLESTLKAICSKRGWKFNGNDTAKKLLDICFENDLIPAFWQSSMGGLRSILEGGVPTARSKLGAHGQGEKPVEVPQHIASYVLHMTASTLVFLVKAEENL